ncbi:MAG: MBOAT family protein [Oscillospiraceae bacterium]|nr:MBOAT family protein [Oscillospiraceae bacterium]
MEFASVTFIWVFLPSCLILFYLLYLVQEPNHRISAQNVLLLVFSFVFYLWGGVYALLLFLCMILFNYGAGIWIDCFSGEEDVFKKSRKGVFVAAVLGNLLLLCFFKYFNILWSFARIIVGPKEGLKSFIIDIMKCDGSNGTRRIGLPLAISFVVFQSISYLADVYKRKIQAEKSLLSFALYLSFFAQLVQGPIMRYEILGKQIKDRTPSVELFGDGVKRFCYGLGKKVIIANTIAIASDRIWGLDLSQICTAEAWIGVLLYSLQIYYDFSGYSDMAIGIGKMFGFSLSENFNYPYTSSSIQEFWRRWHMTLSFWFRDYLYIPLGGNRKGLRRTLFNLFVVFLATGIWHGANLTFVVWGVWFAFLSIIERLFLGNLLSKNPIKFINWLYTIFAVSFGWVFFRSPHLYHAYKYIKVMFMGVPEQLGTSIASYFNADLIIAVVFGILLSGMIQRLVQPVYQKAKHVLLVKAIEIVLPLTIFGWSLLLLLSGSYNPSIYGAF